MALHLSSFRMGERYEDLLAMTGRVAQVVVVANAVDFMPIEARRIYAKTVVDPLAWFDCHGLHAVDFGLRRFFDKPAELARKLTDPRLVQGIGGNAFLLKRAIRRSGLDAVLEQRLSEGSLVHGGWIAGAVVAGPTLRGIEIMDDPFLVADGYPSEPVWEGLGLIDVTIVPHFDSDHPEADAVARCGQYMTDHGIPHRILREGEVITRPRVFPDDIRCVRR